jgi:DNA-binding GntR family transcriptional regulator
MGEQVMRKLLDSEQSLYQILTDAGVVIHHALAEIAPATAGRELGAKLGVKPTTLLLRLDQTDFAPDGQALLYSEEHLVADRLSVMVYRKGPGG